MTGRKKVNGTCESCGHEAMLVTVVLPDSHTFRVCGRCALAAVVPLTLPFEEEGQ